MTIAEQFVALHETLGRNFDYNVLRLPAIDTQQYTVYTFKDGSSVKHVKGKRILRVIDAIDELEG